MKMLRSRWGIGFLNGCFRIAPLAACISSGIYFFYRSRVAVMKYWWASGRVIAWKKVLGFDPHLFVLIWLACIDVLFGFSFPVLIFSFNIYLVVGFLGVFKNSNLVLEFSWHCGCSDLLWVPFFRIWKHFGWPLHSIILVVMCPFFLIKVLFFLHVNIFPCSFTLDFDVFLVAMD